MNPKINKKFIKLSHVLRSGDARYPGNPDVKINPMGQMDCGEKCNTYEVSFFNHNGTHIDFPRHFVADGRDLGSYEMSELIFETIYILNQPCGKGESLGASFFSPHLEALKKAEALLLRTGHQKYRGTEYFSAGPYISKEGAAWLRANCPNLKCIGLDTLSLTSLVTTTSESEGKEVHVLLLSGKGAPFVVEDMDLAALPSDSEIKRLYIVPWFIEKIDGGPCTAFVEAK